MAKEYSCIWCGAENDDFSEHVKHQSNCWIKENTYGYMVEKPMSKEEWKKSLGR